MGFNLKEMILGKDRSIESASTLTPEQDKLLKTILGQFGSQGGANYQAPDYNGQLNYGLSGNEQMSLDALEQQSVARATGQLNPEMDKALLELVQNRGASTGGDFENFFKTNVQDPALQSFEQDVKPTIGRTFGGADFFSGDRAKADDTAAKNLITDLTRQRANLKFQGAETAADRLLNALGLGQNIQNSRTDNILKELNAFGLERQVGQQGLDKDYADFLRKQDQNSARTNAILNALGIRGKENFVDPGSTGLLQEFLAGAANAGGKALAGKMIP
jgi:hypothetical protein